MSPDPASSRYRRRNRWPILVVLVLLVAGAIVVWTQVLKPAPPLATGCNKPGPAPSTTSTPSGTSGSAGTAGSAGSGTPGTAAGGSTSANASTPASGQGLRRAAPGTGTPTRSTSTAAPSTGTGSTGTGSTGTGSSGAASGATASGASSSGAASSSQVRTSLGSFTDPNTLAATRPADPSQIPLRVLNASTVTGQAKTVTDELRNAGFTAIDQQGNDPLYPASDLHCYGEIRYGWAGLAEARTVLIIAPCAQLVRDERSDNSVDLALGALYKVQPISASVRDELTQIKNAAAPPPVIEGQTISVRPVPTIPPLPSRAGCPS